MAEVDVAFELNLTPSAWRALPIEDRAEMMALVICKRQMAAYENQRAEVEARKNTPKKGNRKKGGR